METDIQYLAVPLPEDIQKLKWSGELARCQKVIAQRLAGDLPFALRKRLELEQQLVGRLPQHYIYTFDEALEKLADTIDGFTSDELEYWRDEDGTDWANIEGEVRFATDIVDNLVKTRSSLAARVKKTKNSTDKEVPTQGRELAQQKMRENGYMGGKFHIRTSIRIHDEYERPGSIVRVHLPIPLVYAQVKSFTLRNVVPDATLIADALYPQRTVFFEQSLQQGQVFSVEYDVEIGMQYVQPTPENILEAQPSFYTEEYAPHIVFTPYIRMLTEEVVGQERNPLLKARRIYDYITSQIMYSFVRPYVELGNLCEYTATARKGDCGLQALLFITMCRCAGVPAKWQSGLYAELGFVGNHDWAQFYVAPYGWLYADCSFGGSAFRKGDEEGRNFYFGNLDPYRLPFASEFQHPLNPEMRFLRSDPYDNQVGEVEYDDMALQCTQFDTKHEIVAFTEIVHNIL